MGISARINGWVEDRRKAWGGALGDFLLGSISKGIYKGLADMEPGTIDGIKDRLTLVRDNPDCPEDLKALIDKVITPGNPLLIVVGAAVLLLTMTGMLNALMAPVNRALEYKVDRGVESFRMDPGSIITAWRRDKGKYAFLLDDLDEQGWSETKIEALKFLTEIIPGVSDLIRMSVREAFSPEIAEKFGQYQDPPVAVYPWAEKLGLSKEWVNRYWAAHWELPSAGQGFELLHRGIIDDDTLNMLLRALDVMPYWREKLIAMSWEMPTRVDVRRFWEYGTIDEKRLREVYTAIGYHGKDLDDYVLWTKVYTAFPDLMTRFKNGWLALDDVRAKLIRLGMPKDKAEELIQTKVKAAASEKLAKDKDLTAAEIIKGVKKAVITYQEGLELLEDLGYDEWEAEFKLAIELAVETGSPDTYTEFKDLTTKWKLATGREVKPMPEEIKKAAAEVVRLTKEVAALNLSIAAEKKGLIATEVLPEETTKRLKGLEVTRNRAISELERVKSEYDRLVAEWKHTVQL